MIDNLCPKLVQAARDLMRDNCYDNAAILESKSGWNYASHLPPQDKVRYAEVERILGDRIQEGSNDSVATIQQIIYLVTGKCPSILN